MLKEIHAYLEQLGQPHLALGLDSLTPLHCRAFLDTLKTYGPKILKKQQALLHNKQERDLSACRPLLSALASGCASDKLLGETALREGKAGCVILAGGQASRLNGAVPKGMLPISPFKGKSLFQFLCERVVCAGKKAQRPLPVTIMTSSANHAQTQAFFAENALFGLDPAQLSFFTQEMLPFIDHKGNWLVESPGVLAIGPDGNGNALKSFYAQGLWNKWRQEGVEWINVIFIDNPLADPFDSEFIGFTIRNAVDIGMKVVKRLSSEEKMGVVVQENERLKVIEYLEFSPERSQDYLFASPGLFCFRMGFIGDLYADNACELPWHLASKMASLSSKPSERMEVLKCETFQFDLLEFAKSSAALLYPRECTYAPIKNANGDKSPATAREALVHFNKQIYTELSGLPAPDFDFELDPAFYYPTETLKRSMRGRTLKQCDYITVESLD
ncbi:MAG TPA: UTP--glucose-1-phosphate uridylyltransferase [Rhabdochlamydiaceae bacterium]|jgi:UDP-N-acetylglucosamine/UDP-N-acetylgalactosamine diphosphorylase